MFAWGTSQQKAESEAHAVVYEGEGLTHVDLDLAEVLDHQPLALHV